MSMQPTYTYKKHDQGGWLVLMTFKPMGDKPIEIGALVRVRSKWEVRGKPDLGRIPDRDTALGAMIELYFKPRIAGLRGKLKPIMYFPYQADRVLTDEVAHKVYDILVEDMGAPESMRDSFIIHHTDAEDTPYEWRFSGVLGFGGKFRNGHYGFGLSCYVEDSREWRSWLMAKAGFKLEKIYEKSQEVGLEASLSE